MGTDFAGKGRGHHHRRGHASEQHGDEGRGADRAAQEGASPEWEAFVACLKGETPLTPAIEAYMERCMVLGEVRGRVKAALAAGARLPRRFRPDPAAIGFPSRLCDRLLAAAG